MNSVTAVLLALVLIAVILLIVWLVLRSRSSDLPRGATADGPGVDVAGGPAGLDPAAVEPHSLDDGLTDGGLGAHHLQDVGDEAAGADALDAHLTEHPEALPDTPSDDSVAAAEEYVESGLSELEIDAAGVELDPLSGPAPRTTAEAFGAAQASGDVAAHEAASRETSVLDEADVDSTPLFRSIREELLGSGSPEGPVEDEELTHEVMAEQPEVDLSWSDERRAWDEQAHAESEETDGAEAMRQSEAQGSSSDDTVTEGAVETGAQGTGPRDPATEEEELLQTSQETQDEAIETSPSGDALENPPIRRLSELHEVVDGGFGIGSAKTIADGAQPLGHPIKANVDTKTYQDLHSPWYDVTEPDVWFLDAGFAERAGFHRAE